MKKATIGEVTCVMKGFPNDPPGYTWKVTVGRTYKLARAWTGEGGQVWYSIIADDGSLRCYHAEWFKKKEA